MQFSFISQIWVIKNSYPNVIGEKSSVSWKINENCVDTPDGKLYRNQETNSLDIDLADKIFMVETESSKKKEKGWTRETQIQKLHKYFGHCHADSLWRIFRQSSNKEEFTHAEIEKICEECQTCQLSKRKSSRKKTSLPRSSSFNEVVTMDLKCFWGQNVYLVASRWCHKTNPRPSNPG